MNRCSLWVSCTLVAMLASSVSAQTTGTPTTTPTTPTVQTNVGSSIANPLTTGEVVGSFSGGQAGTSMTGGAGFSGGNGFVGGQGGTGTQGGRTGTTVATPTTSNPFNATYKTYAAAGIGATTKTFGQPLFATVTTQQAGGQAGARGGAAGFGARGAATTGLQGMGAESTGFSTVGIRRAPAYATSLGRDIPIIIPPPMTLLNEIRTSVAATDAIVSKQGVNITMEGNTVVLRGRVEDERERRVLEGMVRLTPGVRDIRNELTTK